MLKGENLRPDYLTSMREDRQSRLMKAMTPFVYENMVKTILSKSKDASKSRTYLTHLSPGYIVSLADKANKNGEGNRDNSEKPK